MKRAKVVDRSALVSDRDLAVYLDALYQRAIAPLEARIAMLERKVAREVTE